MDVETTGLNPDTCLLLEGTFWVLDRERFIFIDSLHLRLPVDPDAIRGNTVALGYHTRNGLLEECVAQTDTTDTLKRRLVSWLGHYFGNETITTVGSNLWKLDIPFLRQHLSIPDSRWLHRYVDPGTVLFNPLTMEKPPSLEECGKLLHLPLSPDNHRSNVGVSNLYLVMKKLYETWYCRLEH